MTIKEKAVALRQALKAKGWGPKQVGVRSDENSLSVRVKDASVPLSVVKEMANAYKSIRYCEISGDPLMGGNTYVSVDYDYDTLKEAAKQYVSDCEAAIAKLGPYATWDTMSGYEVAGTDHTISWNWSGHLQIRKGNEVPHYCTNAQNAAEAIVANR